MRSLRRAATGWRRRIDHNGHNRRLGAVNVTKACSLTKEPGVITSKTPGYMMVYDTGKRHGDFNDVFFVVDTAGTWSSVVPQHLICPQDEDILTGKELLVNEWRFHHGTHFVESALRNRRERLRRDASNMISLIGAIAIFILTHVFIRYY